MTVTNFNPNAMPTNLLTVPEWRKLANATDTTWMGAVRSWARRRGGALVLRADGSLRVFTLLPTGKISQSTYKPGAWAWEGAAQ